MSIDTCSICALSKKVAVRNSDGGAVCHNCYNRSHVETCSFCGRKRSIAIRKADGSAICHRCYQENHKELCSVCGKLKTVNSRTMDGAAICGGCRAKRNQEPCTFCGQLRTVNARLDNRPVCCACYILLDPKQFFRAYRNSAKDRGYDFSLTFEEFVDVVSEPCWYCGEYNRLGKMSGIDRVDNSAGYVTGNVVSCCGECNRMKGELSQIAFVTRIRLIASRLPLVSESK